jgi:hypothetical protein
MIRAPDQPNQTPDEQLPEESGKAYQAFRVFLGLGPDRTIAATITALAKSESLVRDWAARHRWWERARGWDASQSRQDGAVARRERDAVVQQLMDDASRLWRAGMAYFWSQIDRDPETGKAVFGPKFTPAVAVKLCDLALRVQTNLAGRPDSQESDQPADPFQLTSGELRELIDLTRELTQGKEPTDEDAPQQ